MIHPRSYFYPRSPCGERLILTISICTALRFLSTLSLRRATIPYQRQIDQKSNFYPRSPCGERRANNQTARQKQRISIHALLAESDTLTDDVSTGGKIFLSTLSLRRATYQQTAYFFLAGDFYPRSPCGERRRRSIR